MLELHLANICHHMHLRAMCSRKGSQGQVCFTYLYYLSSDKLHTVAKFMQTRSSKVKQRNHVLQLH